jgi:4-hydroxy-tetrahydrodipicolinate reductase
MVSIAVCGACGRMAGQVIRRAVDDKGIKIVAAIDVNNIGKDIGEVLGVGRLGVSVVGADKLDAELKAKKPQLLVDFTMPEACVSNVKIAAANKVGVIVGTTGLKEEQLAAVRDAIKKAGVPGMISSNFSIGMNVLFKMAGEAAKALNGYDIEIIEAHHNKKKDAPSGTAVSLAKIIEKELGRDLTKDAVYGRQGIIGERKPNEIGIHAIRAGDIAGEHTVLYAATGERLELKYMAHSRDAFAMGCVRAIKWMGKQKPGMYEMSDVLGLK